MSQSAFKKYSINQLPTDPSQITSGFVVDTFSLGGPDFSARIYYQKVGKLYFGFNNTITLSSTVVGVVCDDGLSNADNADRIATLLGVTVNTIYTATSDVAGGTNTGDRITFNGTKWVDNGVATGTILYAFLAN